MASQSGEDFVQNPVNSFLLIKKTNKDLQKFVDTLNLGEKLKGYYSFIKKISVIVFQITFRLLNFDE